MTQATYYSAITINLPDAASETQSFELLHNMLVGAEFFERGEQYSIALDANGDGSINLPTPDGTGDAILASGAINIGSANGLLVHNNVIDTTTGYGIVADSCTGLIRIHDNTIDAAKRGIHLRDNADDGFTVSGNTIRDCTGPGIYLFSTGNISPIVTGNHLKNNNTGTEENAQLYWAGNTTQGRCTDNTVWDDPGGTTYSINIAGTGVWVDGNDCYGGAVNVSGTGNTTGTNRT